MSKNIASDMDVDALKAFNNALNFLQESKARTILVSEELFEWLLDIRITNSKLTRGISARLMCDTALEGLVIHECNTENGTHDFTNLGDEDVSVDISMGNHD